MKKTILSLMAVTAITASAMAQVTVAPEIGLNLANMKFKDPMETINTSMHPGLLVGLNVNCPVADNIDIQPGIFYKMTGANTSSGQKIKFNLNTLEIPVNAYYKFGQPGGNRFSAGIGLYLAMNISGKAVASDYTDAQGNFYPGFTQTLKFGSTAEDGSGNGDDLKQLDLGMSFNAAYQLTSGLFFHARYQFGFTNLNPTDPSNYSIRSNALSVSLGYVFGTKPAKKKQDIRK